MNITKTLKNPVGAGTIAALAVLAVAGVGTTVVVMQRAKEKAKSKACPTDPKALASLSQKVQGGLGQWLAANPKPQFPLQGSQTEEQSAVVEKFETDLKVWWFMARDTMVVLSGKCGTAKTQPAQQFRQAMMCGFLLQVGKQSEDVMELCAEHPEWDPLYKSPWDFQQEEA